MNDRRVHDLARVSGFGALLLSTAACNGQFRFDELVPDGGADAGISASADADTDADAKASGTACVRDEHCASFGLKCDAPSGSCVVCTDDVDCGGTTPRCDIATQRCVECGTSSDCGDAGRCEPRTRRCQATCSLANPLCPNGAECEFEDGRLLCRRCEHDDDCAGRDPLAPHCDPNLFVCVSCTKDSDCSGAAPTCDRTRGRCVMCTRRDQCPLESPICDAQGVCVRP